MGRPRLIETEEILETARETFLEEGVGATTAAIARRAGISEATIFQRFRTKRDLFFAAMGFPEFDARTEIQALARGETVRKDIEAISMRLLEYLNQMVPILARLLAHPAFNAVELAETHPEMPARALVEATAEYVDSERRRGRLGACDPQTVAATIFGVLHNFALLEHLGLLPRDEDSRKKLVHSFVDLLWNGMKGRTAEVGHSRT